VGPIGRRTEKQSRQILTVTDASGQWRLAGRSAVRACCFLLKTMPRKIRAVRTIHEIHQTLPRKIFQSFNLSRVAHICPSGGPLHEAEGTMTSICHVWRQGIVGETMYRRRARQRI
jgi:hypothetical protein